MNGRIPMDPEMRRAGVRAFADPSQAPVMGKVTPITLTGAPTALSAQPTQLISSRFDAGQWLVTMMPLTQRGANPGGFPGQWNSTFDGTTTNPDFTNVGQWSAPWVPHMTNGRCALQLAIRWGVGGAAWQTLVDYPLAGTVFGIVADRIDIDVAVRPNAATLNGAAAGPVAGLTIAPGIAAEPTPLRWQEDQATFNGPGPGNGVWFAVKPYARNLEISVPGAAANDVWNVEWLDPTTQVVKNEKLVAGANGIDVVLAVPAGAALVNIQNTGAANHPGWLEWQIGLT